MFKTATVSQLRADLASYIKELSQGPLVLLSHSQPAAVIVDPEMFEALLERVEYLEDVIEGRQAVAEFLADEEVAVNAEDVFDNLGV